MDSNISVYSHNGMIIPNNRLLFTYIDTLKAMIGILKAVTGTLKAVIGTLKAVTDTLKAVIDILKVSKYTSEANTYILLMLFVTLNCYIL